MWFRPSTLAQFQEYIDLHRGEYYLDGPNDVDWIFRNEIIDQRESTLYVDYVAPDEGHQWTAPFPYQDTCSSMEPLAIWSARCLSGAGVCDAESLAVVAEVWQTSPTQPDTAWPAVRALNIRTLEELDARGLLKEQSPDVYRWIANEWQFPCMRLSYQELQSTSMRCENGSGTGIPATSRLVPAY